MKGLQFNLKQKSNFSVKGASQKMLAGFQLTKQNGPGTGEMQITPFTNASNRNLLQAAANTAKHYAFHCILLFSILYSCVENLCVCY